MGIKWNLFNKGLRLWGLFIVFIVVYFRTKIEFFRADEILNFLGLNSPSSRS